MLGALLGKKIGMTQIFDQDGTVFPVTVIDVANWYVTQIKTVGKDGYAALQLGLLKDKYLGAPFSSDWLKSKKKYFTCFKEVSLGGEEHSFTVGQELQIKDTSLLDGVLVDVTGRSRGLGFQGVVKRWGFAGGPETHGSMFHRRPGSSSNLRAEGELPKGKRFPGHQGDRQVTVEGLKVVKADEQARCLFVKGAVPGKKNTVILIKKQRA